MTERLQSLYACLGFTVISSIWSFFKGQGALCFQQENNQEFQHNVDLGVGLIPNKRFGLHRFEA